MLQVCSRRTPPTLQQPPAHEEHQQSMLHQRKSHISIRDYATYGGKREGKEVIIGPLPMRQKIHNAMGKHADKEGERKSVEYSGQGKQGTDNHKRMHRNRYGMQRRVVQEYMEFRSRGRVRKVV